MKIYVVSDLHLEFSVPELESSAAADVIVLAGDIHVGARAIPWIAQQFSDKPVLYVPGNHEFYHGEYHTVWCELRAATESHGNIHLLNGSRLRIGDIDFFGATLWTDFALYARTPADIGVAQAAACSRVPDFSGKIRLHDGTDERPLTPMDSVRLHTEARNWLAEALARPGTGKRVVITHHLPAEASVAPRYKNDSLSPAFASRLEDLVVQADLWIHGHTHDCMDYQLGACRVLCNPRGYVIAGRQPENPDFDLGLIVEI